MRTSCSARLAAPFATLFVAPFAALLAALLAAVLAGSCSSKGQPPAAAVQPSVRITADNALAVAAAAYRTAFDPVHAARAVTALLELTPDAQPPTVGGVHVSHIDGPQGGTATWTWYDRDGDEHYSDGDAFMAELVDFARDGRTFSGVAFLDDLAVEGNVTTGLAWIASTPLRFRNMRVAVGSATDDVNGSFECTREKRATVTLTSLRLVADASIGLAKLRLGSDVSRNDYLLDYSMGWFGDGTFVDPVLGGTLAFHAEIPMTGIQLMPDPSAGEFSVTGSDGSSLTIAPIDFFTLEIRVDTDGDGEPDATIPAEWSQLAQ